MFGIFTVMCCFFNPQSPQSLATTNREPEIMIWLIPTGTDSHYLKGFAVT